MSVQGDSVEASTQSFNVKTDDIPNETWTQIFTHVDHGDLKALRLVGNARLSLLASSLLFSTAYLAARRGVLDTFVALTTHPEFRKYVKHIVYDRSYFDYQTVNDHVADKCASALEKMYQEQETILREEFQPCIEKAFGCLDTIKTLRYADMARYSYLSGDKSDPSWDFDYHDGPLMLRTESSLEQDFVNASLAPNNDLDINGSCKIGHSLTILLKTISDSPFGKVEEVILGDNLTATIHDGIPYQVLATPASPMKAQMSSAFGLLRRLTLWIWLPSFRNGHKNPYAHVFGDNLVSILGSAQHLEQLKLGSDYSTYAIGFANAFAQHTWSKLRTLEIHNFQGTISELCNFIKRHRGSLRHMIIADFLSKAGKWCDLKAALPEIAPQLELLLGIIKGSKCTAVQSLFPLEDKGVKQMVEADNQGASEEEEGKDGLTGDSASDVSRDTSEDSELDLSYDSDDSSSSTASCPRRQSNDAFLLTLSPERQKMVHRLQAVLKGCSVGDCHYGLVRAKEDVDLARKFLLHEFGLKCLVRNFHHLIRPATTGFTVIEVILIQERLH